VRAVRLRGPIYAAAFLLILLSAPGEITAQPAARPEIRAMWVDGFHAGIRTAEEARQLVADARRLHLNTLFVQVRRRGDAFYASSLEPPVEDPAFDPAFDALAFILGDAHAAGLQVHAWINAMPLWRTDAPPKDPAHLFNRHGPSAPGDENWLTRSREGNERFPVGYFLDPGHPAARDHLVSVYLDIVRRYPVDGIHFDYIRYPETEERLPRGADVGYNPVSLARFARAAGVAPTAAPIAPAAPAPDDEAWTRWRRRQVTELVRRISIEARAIRPRIRVSAAVIAWGHPPGGTEDFADASPMQRIFQDWRAWLDEGLLDLAVPMNYAREHDPTVRQWFDGWIAWEKRHKGERQLAIGVGAYLSQPRDVLAQIARVRSGRGRRMADGVSIYSYASPSAAPTPPAPAPAPQPGGARAGAPQLSGAPSGAAPAPALQAQPDPARLDFLVNGVSPARGAFAGPAPVPPMPWLDRPTRGYLAGIVTDAAGTPLEGVPVRVVRRRLFGGTKRTVSDANGWFGLTDLKPGRYRLEIEGRHEADVPPTEILVETGQVARAALVVDRK